MKEEKERSACFLFTSLRSALTLHSSFITFTLPSSLVSHVTPLFMLLLFLIPLCLIRASIRFSLRSFTHFITIKHKEIRCNVRVRR